MIRPAEEADRAAIVALHLASWQDSYGIELNEDILRDVLPGYLAKKWAPRRFVDPLVTLVAEGPDDLDGFACALTSQAPPLVNNLHVRPGRRGGGTGARLLAAMGSALLEKGFSHMTLTVLEKNLAAHRFYLTQGGKDAGRETDALVDHPVVVRRIVFDLPMLG